MWGYLNRPGNVEVCLAPRSSGMGSPQHVIVGFNLKFDLTWCKRYGILVVDNPIWDCQLAHYLLTGQSQALPSLDGVAATLGLGQKLDVVKTQYWDKGIDTSEVPEEVLREYLTQDLVLTEQVYLRQVEAFKKHPQLYKLFQLQCEDLKTLIEMEWNGLVVNTQEASKRAIEVVEQVRTIDRELEAFVEGKPVNWASNDHCSVVMYGGTIVHEVRQPVGVYKTGEKAGQARYKILTYDYQFPGLTKPPKGSELAKEGYYSTDEDTLRNLGGGKQVARLVELLLTRSRLEKLRGTYYVGIPEQLQRSNSFDGRLHGQFNQCIARTGRLSSSAPNLQNLLLEMKELLPSRYE